MLIMLTIATWSVGNTETVCVTVCVVHLLPTAILCSFGCSEPLVTHTQRTRGVATPTVNVLSMYCVVLLLSSQK